MRITWGLKSWELFDSVQVAETQVVTGHAEGAHGMCVCVCVIGVCTCVVRRGIE